MALIKLNPLLVKAIVLSFHGAQVIYLNYVFVDIYNLYLLTICFELCLFAFRSFRNRIVDEEAEGGLEHYFDESNEEVGFLKRLLDWENYSSLDTLCLFSAFFSFINISVATYEWSVIGQQLVEIDFFFLLAIFVYFIYDFNSDKDMIKLEEAKKKKEERLFKMNYVLGNLLGEGYFAKVYEAFDRDESHHYAVKIVEKKNPINVKDKILTDVEISKIRREVKSLQLLKNLDYVVQFQRFFNAPSCFYIVTELCTGGELFKQIVKNKRFYEIQAKNIIRVIATALKHCHDRNIIHRDVKPENILLSSEDLEDLKLADFGLSIHLNKKRKKCSTICGTPQYVAPEMISGERYDTSVDVWSLGVITYILLSGFAPFGDINRKILFTKIRKGEFNFPSPYFDKISFSAKDFIRKCLTVNVAKRIKINEVFDHPWLRQTGGSMRSSGGSFAEHEVNVEELKKFNARKKLRIAVLKGQAAAKMRFIGQSFSKRSFNMNKSYSKDGGGLLSSSLGGIDE